LYADSYFSVVAAVSTGLREDRQIKPSVFILGSVTDRIGIRRAYRFGRGLRNRKVMLILRPECDGVAKTYLQLPVRTVARGLETHEWILFLSVRLVGFRVFILRTS